MIKYKKNVLLPRSGQMKVSPEQSEALQKILFTYGYYWSHNMDTVSNTNRNYIMWSDKTSNITFGNEASPNFYICHFDSYFSETGIDAEECIGGIFSDWDTAHEEYRKYAASTDAVRYQEKLAWLEENYNLIRK